MSKPAARREQPYEQHPALDALRDYLRTYDDVCALARRTAKLARHGTDERNPYEARPDKDPGIEPGDLPIGESDLLGLHGYFTAIKGEMERELGYLVKRLAGDLDEAGKTKMFARRVEDWQDGRRVVGRYARIKDALRRARDAGAEV